MATLVTGTDIGGAWLAAFGRLVQRRGDLVNLVVAITDPLSEDRGVRRAIENELDARLRRGDKPVPQSVHTVANTIFPISLYRRGPKDAADRFFKAALLGQRSRHGRSARWGTYVGRLLDYSGPKGHVNQLALALDQLRTTHPSWSDRYELPITVPGVDSSTNDAAADDVPGVRTGDLRLIADAHSDHYARGGPCLAHISLTLIERRLHMTATYRRQAYIARAYGNFVGLARLQAFLAFESGNEPGELVVVATHAEADGTGARALLRSATQLSGDIHPIETESRPLGSSWDDLDLASGE